MGVMDISEGSASLDEEKLLCDVALRRYFTEGGGKSLIALYSTLAEHYESEEDLYRAIDQIPLNIMQVFINNIMMRSFGEACPAR